MRQFLYGAGNDKLLEPIWPGRLYQRVSQKPPRTIIGFSAIYCFEKPHHQRFNFTTKRVYELYGDSEFYDAISHETSLWETAILSYNQIMEKFIWKMSIYRFLDAVKLIGVIFVLLFAHTGMNPFQISILISIWSVTQLLLEVPLETVASRQHEE